MNLDSPSGANRCQRGEVITGRLIKGRAELFLELAKLI